MTATARLFWYWAPRVLAILFAAFLGVFALDVFTEPMSFGKTVVALAIHLIPSALIVGVLLLAWKWEWVGAAVFGLLGLLYASHYSLPLGIPLEVIATLFWFDWVHRAELHPRH